MSEKIVQAVGLSMAYRAIWARDGLNDHAFDELMVSHVLDSMDSESQQLLRLSCDLSRYVADNRLAPYLSLDAHAAMSLFPEDTQTALKKFGYLNEIPSELGSPPLQSDAERLFDADETLSHYGLKYIPDVSATFLTNRDVVDAGSYDGTSAKFFLNNYPVSRVFCFEPDPANFALLKDNTASERENNAIILTQSALSNTSGLSAMSQAGVGSSRSKAELASQPSILVKTVPLDQFLISQPDANIGLIKLDVEGDAVPVLQGAVNTIRRHKPILIVSFYHTPREFAATPPYLIETFPEYDFKVRKVTPNLFKENVIIGTPK